MAFPIKPVYCLPHAGGGVSNLLPNHGKGRASSPRRWGCFRLRCPLLALASVFPTQVGVFLRRRITAHCAGCLPHAGGGVSPLSFMSPPRIKSSPRRWGCFHCCAGLSRHTSVFPTQVGVFLAIPPEAWAMQGLPHAGGGVSGFFRLGIH